MTDRTRFTDNPLGTTVRINDVTEAFEFLDSWEDRYSYVIDLGKQLPAFPENEKTEANRVHGCQSQVWLIHWHNADDGKLYFLIDSDALIVRGLAAIVLVALNAHSPQEAVAIDVDALFQRLDLIRHVSPTRGNGLRAMVAKIQACAASYAAQDSAL